MREHLLSVVKPAPGWYTLTYSEGTWICKKTRGYVSIHPHIQWGNSLGIHICPALYDTPSHTVREPLDVCPARCSCRYTLTYSEGTVSFWFPIAHITIHPHIQWGNPGLLFPCPFPGDTPSHTVRERIVCVLIIRELRYTLTYSEGTSGYNGFDMEDAIHPHIQWGNPV